MKNSAKKTNLQKDTTNAGPSATRSFQRTEKDIDNISKSEKEFMNKKTREGNTKPDKNKIN